MWYGARLNNMIDWFTVIAQIINFLVLVWLLKRFLFGPITKAVYAREATIKSTLLDAEETRKSAIDERDRLQKKIEELENSRVELMRKAEEEAYQEKKKQVDKVMNDVTIMKAKMEASLRNEQWSLRQNILRKMQSDVMDTTRKIIKDLSTSSFEERVIEKLIEKLHQAEGCDLSPMSGKRLTVKSTFEIPDYKKKELEMAIGEVMVSTPEIVYSIKSDMICGIEISSGDFKLVWSVSDYMHTLSKGVEGILKEKFKSEPK
jgi:F-type H+-transporting ATPase subunit b